MYNTINRLIKSYFTVYQYPKLLLSNKGGSKSSPRKKITKNKTEINKFKFDPKYKLAQGKLLEAVR
jgi:hypothetical protein